MMAYSVVDMGIWGNIKYTDVILERNVYLDIHPLSYTGAQSFRNTTPEGIRRFHMFFAELPYFELVSWSNLIYRKSDTKR
jgi:hypothetical protein